MYSTILSRGNWIGFSKPLARGLGSIEAALLLSEVLNQFEYFKASEVFITNEHFEAEILLTPYKIREAVKVLKQNNLIEVNRRGVPAKNHYKLPVGFNSSIEKILHPVVKNFDDCKSNNFTTINKTIKQEEETPAGNFIDFVKLVSNNKNIGLLGRVKAVCQVEMNYVLFDEYDNKKLNEICYSIKSNLKVLNQHKGGNVKVDDEKVLQAFKMTVATIKGKTSDTPSISYIKSCLSPSLYLDVLTVDGVKDLTKFLEVVKSKFSHYKKFTPDEVRHLRNIILALSHRGDNDLKNFKELFDNLPKYILEKKAFQSVGFIAKKIEELKGSYSTDAKVRQHPDFETLKAWKGEKMAVNILTKKIKKNEASNS